MSVNWEHDEAMWTRQTASESDRQSCGAGRHDMRANRAGGGTCVCCDETVSAAEL